MGPDTTQTDDSTDVYERDLTEGDSSPKMALLRAIADIEGIDETELPALYSCIDEMIEHFYSNPPSAEAQARLEFSFHGYRITLFQDGLAVIQPVETG